MKKKFFSLLVAVLSIATNLWALDIKAPNPADYALSFATDQECYLYNVGTGQLYTAANSWGTQASVGAEGLKVRFVSESGKSDTYSIENFFKDSWQKLFVDTEGKLFVDANNAANYFFGIEDMGNNIYRIYCADANPAFNRTTYGLGTFIGVDRTTNENNTALHPFLNPSEGDGKYYVDWMLISELGAAKIELYNTIKSSEKYETLLEEYINLYNNEQSTAQELKYASADIKEKLIMSSSYAAPWWSEYPILFSASEFGDDYNDWYNKWVWRDNAFKRRMDVGVCSLNAYVNVDETSTFVYTIAGSISISDMTVDIYVDGVKIRTLKEEQISGTRNGLWPRFLEVLQPGKHTLTWVVTSNIGNIYDREIGIWDVGVLKSSQQLTVDLLEPGSLGTEVLYQTDHIKNVRRLKVKGAMNDDDWAKIHMMSTLLELDLSEAKFTEIPASQFNCYNDTTMRFLHVLTLPEGLKRINNSAFCYSFIDHLDFPSTVESVGCDAFVSSHLKELVLPDNLTTIENYSYRYLPAFCDMYWMEKLVCPKNLTVIPEYTFQNNYFCTDVVLPEKLETIQRGAFYANRNIQVAFPEGLKTIEYEAFSECWLGEFSALPESLTSIGDYAFFNCDKITHLVIPDNVTTIGGYAFAYCDGLTDAELGVNLYSLSSSIFGDCSRLKTLKLNSATVAGYNTDSYYYPLNAEYLKDVTLVVPQFLVNSYKLDSYWYNFKSIEGFETDDVDYWAIHNPLTLNRERFGGNPSVKIYSNTYLKVNGDTEQQFNNFEIDYNSSMLSNCKKLTVNGDATVWYNTSANEWYFISLPFDVKVSDIVVETAGAKNAIRYYDGDNRATFGPTGSWTKFEADAVIPAGTGFIYQTSKDTWSGFKAVDNDMKQNIVSVNEFSRDLDVNASEVASNAGWNLVGNPYQCYYNTHKLNFTAPITVWNVSNRTYAAYSITDDDYALAPNEAFFVQCDAGYPTIGFPIDGRQLDNIIVEQNAVKDRMATASRRQFIDLTFTDGQTTDQTRLVINPEAKMDYETSCDASKFMSMDTDVPQIYTLSADGIQYAINERPLGNAEVGLGIYAGKTGTYTLALKRSTAGQVYLKDNESGEVTEITDLGVKVCVEAGKCEGRFSLVFAGSATGIEGLDSEPVEVQPSVFNLNGQAVSGSYKGIVISNGKKILKK